MSDIVILAATRTPLGAFQGELAGIPAPLLGAAAIKGALSQSGLTREAVTDVIMGCALQAGLGQAPARQAALGAGLPPATRCVTVNKVCGSGLQAVIYGRWELAAGDADVVIAGGMENMSAAPYLLPHARQGYRLGHRQVIDSMVHDGLWDPHLDQHMGQCAEACATKYGITREQQDAYAIESYRRAQSAQEGGRFAWEITPVETADPRGSARRVERDEGPGRARFEKIPTLAPAFAKDGTITAANASSLNDGAAALVLARMETAAAAGARPLARIVSTAAHAAEPRWFTTAPVQAAREALGRAGWSPAEVELWEVNEAFAVVPLAFARELAVPHDRLNVNGGAIALGHPIGASGARIVVSLLGALRQRQLKRGVAAICIGGGEGLALCVELF